MTLETPRTLVGAIEAVLFTDEHLRTESPASDAERLRRRMRLLVDARVVLGGWRQGVISSEVARRELHALVQTTRELV